MKRPYIKGKWSDERRWFPMDRVIAASIIKNNRRSGGHVYRKTSEIHIENFGVHLVIAKATGGAA